MIKNQRIKECSKRDRGLCILSDRIDINPVFRFACKIGLKYFYTLKALKGIGAKLA